MRVLLLSRYGRLGASSRVRSYQYLPYLSAHGVDVTVAPLLSDQYLLDLYAGRRKNLASVVAAYARRVRDLLRSRKFDLVWLGGEALPWMPAWAEALLTTSSVRYVVDYDDAIFHRYDDHRSPLVRLVLGRKIDAVMRNAHLVVVGNEYLATRAREAGAPWIEYLPSVVDMQRYTATPSTHDSGFTVGWIGSPATAHNLQLIRSALADVLNNDGGRLIAVGAGNAQLDEVPIEVRPWSATSEVQEIQSFDVGIMPLIDNPFAWGKCGFKLVQYMACGRPVIASPVGVNRQIVQHGVNGYLADSPEEWVRALTTLRENPELRRRMGLASRARAERHYSLQVAAPRLLSLLYSAANGRELTSSCQPMRAEKGEVEER